VVDFSFVNEVVKDRYTPDFGRPAEDPEFMLRLCLLQYLYGDSDREVEDNARINLAYKYFLGLSFPRNTEDYKNERGKSGWLAKLKIRLSQKVENSSLLQAV